MLGKWIIGLCLFHTHIPGRFVTREYAVGTHDSGGALNVTSVCRYIFLNVPPAECLCVPISSGPSWHLARLPDLNRQLIRDPHRPYT